MTEHVPDRKPVPTSPSSEAYGTSEIASGYSRYHRTARRLQSEHTGSPDRFLNSSEEQECAQVIEAANIAQEGIVELMQIDAERALAEKERYTTLLEAGQRAKDKLIESNLRFAAYYARASVNIVVHPRKKDQSEEVEDDSLDGENTYDSQFRRRPGAYGDITRLRSRYADLEDRVQVANEGLVEAAATFRPKLDSRGRPISFISHAKYVIHDALSRYSKTEETPGWYVNANQVTKLYQASRRPEDVAPEELERLGQMSEGRYTVPFEDVNLSVVTPQELEEGAHSQEELFLADVVPAADDSSPILGLLGKERDKKIKAALDTLSEREAGVIRMRYGLDDGEPKTLDEIGMVYGVTRERIRQIESKTMGKLRHPSRSDDLRDLVDVESETHGTVNPSVLTSVVWGIPNIRTSRSFARSGEPREEERETSTSIPGEEYRESWQVYPGEPWDTRTEFEAVLQDFEQTARHFERILRSAPLYTFQRSFTKDVGSDYPVAFVDYVNEQLGAHLTASHIEDFWNHHIRGYVDSLRTRLGDDLNVDRVSTLFSRLLAERMQQDSRVELFIPAELNGILNGLGTGLQTGELILRGDIGDFAGYQMGGLASIKVYGSVGDFPAVEASGFSSMEVTGDAGHYVGGQATDAASIHIHGSVKDYCGEGLNGVDAFIEVDGNAGEGVGDDARYGSISINGVGVSATVRSDFKGMINGDFAERSVKEGTHASSTAAKKMSRLAIGYPEGARAAAHLSRQLPRSADIIIAELAAAKHHVDPKLLET